MPFWIEQQAGRKRTIELDGRALPHPGGVRWGGEQRMETVWLPGSPDAIAQLFGPKEKPMSISGRWGDAYMAGPAPDCVVKVDGRVFASALEAAQLLDLVRQEGSLLRVAYESEVRYGFLKSFDYGPFAEGRTLARIDWSMEFEWISRAGSPSAPALPNQIGTSALSNRVAILLQQVEATYNKLQGQADTIRDALFTPVAKLRSIAGTANSVATSWLQRASTAADAAQATIGLTGELAANAYDLANAARSTAYSQAAAIQNGVVQTRSVGGLQTDPGLGKSLVVARDSRQVETHARNLAQLADSVRADTDSAIYTAEPQLAYAQSGEDLRDIALRVLGSADSARDVMMYNGLDGYEVSAGTPILIPRSVRSQSLR